MSTADTHVDIANLARMWLYVSELLFTLEQLQPKKKVHASQMSDVKWLEVVGDRAGAWGLMDSFLALRLTLSQPAQPLSHTLEPITTDPCLTKCVCVCVYTGRRVASLIGK